MSTLICFGMDRLGIGSLKLCLNWRNTTPFLTKLAWLNKLGYSFTHSSAQFAFKLLCECEQCIALLSYIFKYVDPSMVCISKPASFLTAYHVLHTCLCHKMKKQFKNGSISAFKKGHTITVINI